MQVVVVQGPVGSGKTTLLGDVAQRARDAGRTVDGWIQPATTPREPGPGSNGYDLLPLREGAHPVPFLVRQDQGNFGPPPGLDASPPTPALNPLADVVILDEIGRLELSGGAHAAALRTILDARPAFLCLGIRDENVTAVCAAFGIRPALVIDADDPLGADRVLSRLADLHDWRRVGDLGAVAGAWEAGVGSLVHGARLPIAGVVMSSAQAAFLSRIGGELSVRSRLFFVALIAALLKALSPAGARIGPMLAITMQGLLFTIVVLLLGWNRLAAWIGGALIGGWAGLQGFVVNVLLFGSGLERAYDALMKLISERTGWMGPAFTAAVVGIIVGYALSAGFAALGAFGRGVILTPTPVVRSSWPRAFPLLFGIFIVCLLLGLSGSRPDEVLFVALRALAVGLLLMGLTHRIRPHRIVAALQRRGWWGPATAIETAIERQPVAPPKR